MDLVHVVCIGVLNWFIVYMMHINQQINFLYLTNVTYLIFIKNFFYQIQTNKQTNNKNTTPPKKNKNKKQKKNNNNKMNKQKTHIRKCRYEEYEERNTDYILL